MVGDEKGRENVVGVNVINDKNDCVGLEMGGKRRVERGGEIGGWGNVFVKRVWGLELKIGRGILDRGKESEGSRIVIGLENKGNMVD